VTAPVTLDLQSVHQKRWLADAVTV